MKKDPGLYEYTAWNTRPKIEWPNNAKVAFWVAPNIEFYELDPPVNPQQRSWQRPMPDVQWLSGARDGVDDLSVGQEQVPWGLSEKEAVSGSYQPPRITVISRPPGISHMLEQGG